MKNVQGKESARFERRLRRRNRILGGGREECARRRATTVGRGAQRAKPEMKDPLRLT
jgi:hypothetical protein